VAVKKPSSAILLPRRSVVLNEELAIPRVEEFLNLLEVLETSGRQLTFYPQGHSEMIRKKIDVALSLIKQIATECDPDLASRIDNGLNGR
jgi:predicted translin family RNA/ssDNA-binding protein